MGKYLVTGSAGFIAARVAELLLKDGHLVIGVDNMNDAYDVRMKEYRLERLQAQDNFQFAHMDIADRGSFLQLADRLHGVEAVFNLAARAGVRSSVADPWLYYDTNLTGTLNLLDFCRELGITKFILASTSSIYGAEAPIPTPESAASSYPLQPYAASKKAAEVLCYTYHYLHGIDVTINRYFTVYGPAGRPDMSMFRFMQWIAEGQPVRIFGDGEQTRGFTYVDDIARGTIMGLKPVGYEIFNLGGHEQISINDLVDAIAAEIGRPAERQYGPAVQADMLASWADVTKAGRILGWEPHVGLEEGLARMAAWYKSEREWAATIDTGV
jgi:nucleoside-diphosphate-sugar epimerase